MKRKLLSMLLVFCMMFTLMPAALAADGGSDESETEIALAELSLDEQAEYYQAQAENAENGIALFSNDTEIIFKISSVEQLLDLADKVNNEESYYGGSWDSASYEQVNDLDLSFVNWDGIGAKSDAPFRGVYNGAGHQISNLTTNCGLFAHLAGTVENLAVTNCTVDSYGGSGGAIAARAIVTAADTATIRNCWSSGKITAARGAGGIAGEADGGQIENCYSLCEIVENGNDVGYVGGIAGSANSIAGSTQKISSCVFLGENMTAAKNSARIACGTPTLSGNYAWSGVKVNGTTVSGGNANNADGADLTYSANGLNKQFSEIFQNSDAWIFADNCLPVLNGSGDSPQTLPEYMTKSDTGSVIIPTSFVGSGTKEDPYLIQNKADLIFLRNQVNGGSTSGNTTGGEHYAGTYFKQTADIDLTGEEWIPIGNVYAIADKGANRFEGIYDGNGYTISNLTSKNGYEYIGLFGVIGKDTVIKNLGVIDCDIAGKCVRAGAIVGNGLSPNRAVQGQILNCYSTGKIQVTGTAGGIVGSYVKRVENCYSLCTVEGGTGEFVGGIIGVSLNGTVMRCVALNESVTGNTENDSAGVPITCRVTNLGKTQTVADLYAWSGMKVNGQAVAADDANIGTDKPHGASITVTDGTLSKQLSEIFGTIDGEKASDVWNFEDDMLPTLKNENVTRAKELPSYLGTSTVADFAGAGTASDPYLIQNKADLIKLQQKVNSGTDYSGKYFKQTANIDLSGEKWTPIGLDYDFSGIYDGDGHEIANMTVETKKGDNGGLFGNAFDAVITNLAVLNCRISGEGSYHGAIVGSGDVEISNCYATGSISGGEYSGGISGNGREISNCYSTVKITGAKEKAAGIATRANNIYNCVALNSEIRGSEAYRILCQATEKSNNYALKDMKVNGEEVTTEKEANMINGADLIVQDGKLYKEDGTEFWSSWSGYDSAIWVLPTEKGELPHLKYSSKVYLNLDAQTNTSVNVDTAVQSYVYDGSAKAFELKNLTPSTVTLTVEYKLNGENDDNYSESAPINVGEYDVRLSYLGSEGINAYNTVISKGLVITQAGNKINNFTFPEEWIYDEVEEVPRANADFGTVVFTYSADSGKTWMTEQPQDVGSYKIKASVAGTDNYKEAEAIKDFVIKQAEPKITEKPAAAKVKKGKALANSTLSGGRALGVNDEELSGSWAWKDGTEIMNERGTFDRTVIFTPQDSNYKEAETTVSVAVYKTTAIAAKQYTVSFDTGEEVIVEANTTVTEPKTPKKAGYIFKGWYYDQECKHKFDFSIPINEDLTLYAKWIKDESAIADNSNIDNNNIIVLTIGEKNAVVFGKTVTNDVAPLIVNDRTMLPARFVAEALGAKVSWNAETKGVTIINEDVNMLITIGSDTAYVNGEKVKLDAKAFIANGRTYLPLRFICENLGAEVNWQADTQKIIITKK